MPSRVLDVPVFDGDVDEDGFRQKVRTFFDTTDLPAGGIDEAKVFQAALFDAGLAALAQRRPLRKLD